MRGGQRGQSHADAAEGAQEEKRRKSRGPSLGPFRAKARAWSTAEFEKGDVNASTFDPEIYVKVSLDNQTRVTRRGARIEYYQKRTSDLWLRVRAATKKAREARSKKETSELLLQRLVCDVFIAKEALKDAEDKMASATSVG